MKTTRAALPYLPAWPMRRSMPPLYPRPDRGQAARAQGLGGRPAHHRRDRHPATRLLSRVESFRRVTVSPMALAWPSHTCCGLIVHPAISSSTIPGGRSERTDFARLAELGGARGPPAAVRQHQRREDRRYPPRSRRSPRPFSTRCSPRPRAASSWRPSPPTSRGCSRSSIPPSAAAGAVGIHRRVRRSERQDGDGIGRSVRAVRAVPVGRRGRAHACRQSGARLHRSAGEPTSALVRMVNGGYRQLGIQPAQQGHYELLHPRQRRGGQPDRRRPLRLRRRLLR